MNQKTINWSPAAFVVSFLAVGLPYWLIPYSKLNLPDGLIGPGLLVPVLAALMLRAYRGASFWRATNIVGLSVPAAVFARVVVEGVKDPTSHNLWPFEIIIALMMGHACALTGALIGSVAAKIVTPVNASE